MSVSEDKSFHENIWEECPDWKCTACGPGYGTKETGEDLRCYYSKAMFPGATLTVNQAIHKSCYIQLSIAARDYASRQTKLWCF